MNQTFVRILPTFLTFAVVAVSVSCATPQQQSNRAGTSTTSPSNTSNQKNQDDSTKQGKPLSSKKMIANAEVQITDMQGTLQNVLKLQQAARAQKDVIKLNCVNDKLLQVKQLLRIGESARNNLVEATANQNDQERYHQYSQIVISGEKVSVLGDETQACVGDELIFLGSTNVVVVRPKIIDDPTSDNPFDVILEVSIEHPAYASPFL